MRSSHSIPTTAAAIVLGVLCLAASVRAECQDLQWQEWTAARDAWESDRGEREVELARNVEIREELGLQPSGDPRPDAALTPVPSSSTAPGPGRDSAVAGPASEEGRTAGDSDALRRAREGSERERESLERQRGAAEQDARLRAERDAAQRSAADRAALEQRQRAERDKLEAARKKKEAEELAKKNEEAQKKRQLEMIEAGKNERGQVTDPELDDILEEIDE